jgi:hypothetical protein
MEMVGKEFLVLREFKVHGSGVMANIKVSMKVKVERIVGSNVEISFPEYTSNLRAICKLDDLKEHCVVVSTKDKRKWMIEETEVYVERLNKNLVELSKQYEVIVNANNKIQVIIKEKRGGDEELGRDLFDRLL